MQHHKKVKTMIISTVFSSVLTLNILLLFSYIIIIVQFYKIIRLKHMIARYDKTIRRLIRTNSRLYVTFMLKRFKDAKEV